MFIIYNTCQCCGEHHSEECCVKLYMHTDLYIIPYYVCNNCKHKVLKQIKKGFTDLGYKTYKDFMYFGENAENAILCMFEF